MPIYQYKCTECAHQMEALQRMSDPLLTDCPQCHSPSLKKQVTAAAFKLKGTGWYETDFKNSGKKPAPNKKESAANNAPSANKESAAGNKSSTSESAASASS